MQIRNANQSDAPAITRLLRNASFLHMHADWRSPVEWIDEPSFLVAEQNGKLVACLAAAADPPPAAWVRLAAISTVMQPIELIESMLDEAAAILSTNGVTQLAWLPHEGWPQEWFPTLGFGEAPINWVDTYVRFASTKLPPPEPIAGLTIRCVADDDMQTLADIEAEAFEPMWRHSADALRAAKKHSLTFDVALLDGGIVGFQYSTHGSEGAHLVRITLHPNYQGRGLGKHLLQHTIRGYYPHGISTVTLNTQRDNVVSQRLYARFDFHSAQFCVPVWAKSIG